MVRDHVLTRLTLAALFAVMVLALAACYKDAGENVQPTSIRVQLSDLTPTDTPPAASPTSDFLPTDAGPTPTRTLVPTTTPADADPAADEPAETVDAMTDLAAETDAAAEIITAPGGATNTPMALRATFTPAVEGPAEVESMIVTPGLSDIRASNTPRPTIDPTLMPTPTPIPAEENPCIHVVRASDTLYAIARDNEFTLDELVAANPTLLSGQYTYLQIGWELRLPGCEDEGSEAEPAMEAMSPTPGAAPTSSPADGPIIHVVQSGETIFAIGRQYGVSAQAIIAANNIANPDRIRPGDQLTIPAP